MQESLIEHCKETLKKNHLDTIKKLGKGGFGLVYLVSKTNFNNYDTELLSVKCTSKKQFVKKPMLRRYLKQEISILESLDHENIVKLIRTFEDNGWIFMIMEYCDLGNLASIQAQKKQRVYDFFETSEIILDVINGLNFMHSQDIIHRDIKPQNILRTRQQNKTVTKICDLGFSREAKQQMETFCGTTYYMAPELFQKKKYDKSVDIWALGVLIFSMLFGNVPFKSMNMQTQIVSKCQKGFDLQKARKRPNSSLDEYRKTQMSELFSNIFNLDPQKRPNLQKISSYFRKQLIQPEIISSKELYTSPNTHKKTLDTESSSEGDSMQLLSFEIEKVNFIQSVLTQVRELNFLSSIEIIMLKYYLDKICISILETQKSYKMKLTGDEEKAIERLKINVQKSFKTIQDNLHNCNIPDIEKAFNHKIMASFNDFKEEYRIVVGHAFHKAHKNIQNAELKIRTKLKLFCCHIINRVFEKEHRKSLFVYYYNWQEKLGRPDCFQLKHFKEWVQTDKLKRINETVQIINNKFYKKTK